MITDMNADRFATHSLKDARIQRILSAALKAVDPFDAVQKHLPNLNGRVFGLGIGKAAIPMMDALAQRIPLSGGLAVTKFASSLSRKSYSVIESGHPVPDARSLHAGERVLEFVSSLQVDDTLVCLISGGGSSLTTLPHEGITLDDMQALTRTLLACGARIDEINTIRRSLDRVKGGGVARATKARVISLILSDVIGNPLEAIASGPTAPDPTTPEDALAILKKYDIAKIVSKSIIQTLESGSLHPNLQQQAIDLQNVQNIIIGDNRLAAQTAAQQAHLEGFRAEVLANNLQGEACEVGVMLARALRAETSKDVHPFCLIAGGETTVTIKGKGKGGRNQELALSAVKELAGLENIMLISLATDGDDGPTDAAGALVTGDSAQRAASLGLDAADYLARNDAYSFFDMLGDLLKTGPTGTNVNDLIFLIQGNTRQ